MLAQLMSMGFPENGCRRAALATSNNTDAAIEWIFAHLEDDDFDDPVIVEPTQTEQLEVADTLASSLVTSSQPPPSSPLSSSSSNEQVAMDMDGAAATAKASTTQGPPMKRDSSGEPRPQSRSASPGGAEASNTAENSLSISGSGIANPFLHRHLLLIPQVQASGSSKLGDN